MGQILVSIIRDLTVCVNGSLAALSLCLHRLFTSVQGFRLSGVSGSGKLMGCIPISVNPHFSPRDSRAETNTRQNKTLSLLYGGNHANS